MRTRTIELPGYVRWSDLPPDQQKEILDAIEAGEPVKFVSWNKVTYIPTPK